MRKQSLEMIAYKSSDGDQEDPSMLSYETVSKAKKVLLRAQHNDKIPNED